MGITAKFLNMSRNRFLSAVIILSACAVVYTCLSRSGKYTGLLPEAIRTNLMRFERSGHYSDLPTLFALAGDVRTSPPLNETWDRLGKISTISWSRDYLEACLCDGDKYDRAASVYLLGYYAPETKTKIIDHLRGDSDPLVRYMAASALMDSIRMALDVHDASALMQVVNAESSADVIDVLLACCPAMPSYTYLHMLVQLTQRRSMPLPIRVESARRIRMVLKDSRHMPAESRDEVGRLLRSDIAPLRYYAAQALCYAGYHESIPHLIDSLRHVHGLGDCPCQFDIVSQKEEVQKLLAGISDSASLVASRTLGMNRDQYQTGIYLAWREWWHAEKAALTAKAGRAIEDLIIQ